jgi:hypothetical protein
VEGKPQHLPVSAIDYASGNLMAFGAMVTLARRATIGEAGGAGVTGDNRAVDCRSRNVYG